MDYRLLKSQIDSKEIVLYYAPFITRKIHIRGKNLLE